MVTHCRPFRPGNHTTPGFQLQPQRAKTNHMLVAQDTLKKPHFIHARTSNLHIYTDICILCCVCACRPVKRETDCFRLPVCAFAFKRLQVRPAQEAQLNAAASASRARDHYAELLFHFSRGVNHPQTRLAEQETKKQTVTARSPTHPSFQQHGTWRVLVPKRKNTIEGIPRQVPCYWERKGSKSHKTENSPRHQPQVHGRPMAAQKPCTRCSLA